MPRITSWYEMIFIRFSSLVPYCSMLPVEYRPGHADGLPEISSQICINGPLSALRMTGQVTLPRLGLCDPVSWRGDNQLFVRDFSFGSIFGLEAGDSFDCSDGVGRRIRPRVVEGIAAVGAARVVPALLI